MNNSSASSATFFPKIRECKRFVRSWASASSTHWKIRWCKSNWNCDFHGKESFLKPAQRETAPGHLSLAADALASSQAQFSQGTGRAYREMLYLDYAQERTYAVPFLCTVTRVA